MTDESVRGLLVERGCPLEAVARLEAQKSPLCLGARHAVERTIVEPYDTKLYLRPPDVVFRELGGIQPMMRLFRRRLGNVIGVRRKIQSGAADPQRQNS